MRLTISVDNLSHQIDTTDPKLLGQWIVEIFDRTGPWGPSTWATIQAYPSWVPDATVPQGGRPDWLADSRIIGGVYQVTSPQGIVDTLQQQLDNWKATRDHA
jgi:hypothetical protein